MTTELFDTPSDTPTLNDFVGEGKKYADADAVAKALVEKDKFIQRLIEEKRKFEEDVNIRAFEDRLKALEANRPAEQREPPQREAAPAAPTVDIESAVQRAIVAREQENNRSRNLLTVKDKLTEVYGENYATNVKQRAADLGLPLDKVNELAATAPKAFFDLMGLNRQQEPAPVGAPPATQRNSASFTPEAGRKNYAYFQNLRKTDPARYHSPAVQLEEYKEAARQGAAFYS